MKTYTYTTRTHVPADRLYRAVANISRWPEWAGDIEWTAHDGRLEPGSPFTLKPKGGPKVQLEVVEARPASVFTDLARLPLATMRTSHAFAEDAAGTTMTVEISISGPLGFLWDRIIARKQAADAAEQTKRLVAFAEVCA